VNGDGSLVGADVGNPTGLHHDVFLLNPGAGGQLSTTGLNLSAVDNVHCVLDSAGAYLAASDDNGHVTMLERASGNTVALPSSVTPPVWFITPPPSSGGGGGSNGGGGANGGGALAPVLAAALELNKVWTEGNKLPHISRKRRHPVGTVFSFTLNETASVRFSFLLAASGRKVGKRCVAPNKRNRRKHRCTRLVSAGSLTFTGHAGLNKVFFQGRLSRTKRLRLGSYTLILMATNAAGKNSRPQTLRFTIVRR
jgi:hypothetical protein